MPVKVQANATDVILDAVDPETALKTEEKHFVCVFLFTSGFHRRPQLPLVPLAAPGFSAPLCHHPHPLHFGLALGEYG